MWCDACGNDPCICNGGMMNPMVCDPMMGNPMMDPMMCPAAG